MSTASSNTSAVRTPEHQRYRQLALAVLFFCFYVPFCILLAATDDWQFIWFAFFPVDFVIFSVCLLALHESAHALVGWLVGYEMTQIAIGPLLLDATPQGVRPSVRRGIFFTGHVKGDFRAGFQPSWRHIAFTAGGPAIYVLVIFVGSFFLMHGEVSRAVQWQLWFLIVLAAVDLLGNLGCRHSGEVLSDGARIRRMLRHGRDMERVQVHLSLFNAVKTGERPRVWAVDRVDILLSPVTEARKWEEIGVGGDKGRLMEGLGYTSAYYWAWDRGDYALATKLVTHFSELPLYGTSVDEVRWCIESAFCAAAFHANAAEARDFFDGARAWHERGEGNDQQRAAASLDLVRAEAAIRLAEGQHKQAHELCRQWLRQIADLPNEWPGIMLVEREWIETALVVSQPPGTATPATV